MIHGPQERSEMGQARRPRAGARSSPGPLRGPLHAAPFDARTAPVQGLVLAEQSSAPGPSRASAIGPHATKKGEGGFFVRRAHRGRAAFSQLEATLPRALTGRLAGRLRQPRAKGARARLRRPCCDGQRICHGLGSPGSQRRRYGLPVTGFFAPRGKGAPRQHEQLALLAARRAGVAPGPLDLNLVVAARADVSARHNRRVIHA